MVSIGLSQMLLESGTKPTFSQIYIFDQENDLNNRLQPFQNLDKAVLKELQDMIKEVNPNAYLYQQVGDIVRENPTEDIKLVLRCHQNPNIDHPRYNLPMGTDATVILPADRQCQTAMS